MVKSNSDYNDAVLTNSDVLQRMQLIKSQKYQEYLKGSPLKPIVSRHVQGQSRPDENGYPTMKKFELQGRAALLEQQLANATKAERPTEEIAEKNRNIESKEMILQIE